MAFDAAGRPVLKLRLFASPVEGAANMALIAYLADTLGLRKSDISIRSGETSRHKILQLEGDADAIGARLKAWIASA